MDSHSPEIVSVTTGSNPNQVRLVFNEPMEQSSAELNTNYTVNNGIIVTDAALEQDLKTVVLTTLAHVDGKYQLTIRNVKDRAKMSNSIEPNTTIDYLFTGINGLIGAWPFDEVTGETAFDLANHGNHGALTYLIKPDLVKAGPTRVPGVSEQGLQFDGTDDQVTIQGVGLLADVTSSSHTLAVWVNPELVPPGNTANDTSYSLLVRKYSGLYYDQSQKFKAEIQLSDGNRLSLESGVFAPGIWHHVTMVVDDTNKKLHLYVDADEVNGSPISYAGTLADYADAPYYFGTSEPLTNNYEYRLKGKLDEGRIFNQPLTSAEVQALFDWVPTIPIRLPIYLPILIKPN
jgi:hypothetical protein